jgi:uncharacterized Tic20 family protein
MLCLQCNYVDIRLVFTVSYTFARVLYFCLILSSVYVFAAFVRSFVARLRALFHLFIVNRRAALG